MSIFTGSSVSELPSSHTQTPERSQQAHRSCQSGKPWRHIYIIITICRKYWRELNLAVKPKIAIARIILADLNLAVRYGIAIRFMRVGNFGGF